jgi:anti-sigma factor RsiW
MTRCKVEFETLSAFVDGELDPREELDLRRHLEMCQQCHAILDALLGTKAAVASTAEVRAVPHSLRVHVSRLTGQVPRKRQIWLFPVIALTAAVLVSIATYRAVIGQRSTRAEHLAEALVEDHTHYLGASDAIQVASDDPQQIAQAFADQFGFHLKLPNLPGSNLLGARLCWLSGRKAVLTFYKTPTGRFSLFVFDKQGLILNGGRQTECATAHGYEVCFVQRMLEVLAMVAKRQQADAVLPHLERFGAQQH